MTGMDSKKLRKTMTAGQGAILVPLIEAYQQRAKFPSEWQITIKNEKKPDGHFHPSSDAFADVHDLWLDKQGKLVRSSISPALRRTFDIGHMIHGYLQNILLDMELVREANIERYIKQTVEGKYGLCVGAGTGDLVDVEIPGHGHWLVDIKTMKKSEYESGPQELTMKKWTAQVSCYMDWFLSPKAMILAFCKDSPHEMREFQIIRDDVMLKGIYDRWSYVQHCIDKGIEPSEDALIVDA